MSDDRRRDTLTVVIPTKNSAALIGDCLESVRWADEIIVIDMHSTDSTAEICASFPNVRMIEREDYIFGNVNFGFEHATSDWTLRLDSDERLTPELSEEIQGILRDAPPGVTGFYFNQRLVVLGHVLRHGRGAGAYRDMMFRTGSAHYAVEREHEELTSAGRWVHARGDYVHMNYGTVSEYLAKMDYYTSRDVERRAVSRTRPPIRLAFLEVARAFYLYYLKRQGFRDGWPGFVDAGMMAAYQFVQWAKVVEHWDCARRVGTGRA